MKNNKNVKICKIMIVGKEKDKEIYLIDAIDLGIEHEDGTVELLTGSFAGEILPKVGDEEITDGVVCVSTSDIDELKNVIASNDIDEMRALLETQLVDKKYIMNKETNKLEPFDSQYEFSDDYFDDMFNKESKSNVEKKKKSKKDKIKKDYDITKIDSNIRKSIIGQDKAVKKIVTAVYGNQKIFSSNLSKEQKNQLKNNILIVGKTGTGKTEIIKQLAKYLEVPYTIEDATRYTKAGYVGESVENMLINLVRKAEGYIAKAQKGILVIDEIDKKRSSGTKGDVGTEDVQFSLLKLIEGGEFWLDIGQDSNKFLFDTSNLTVIFSGAFTDIFKEEEKSKSIGFETYEEKKDTVVKKELLPEDFIKFGMVPELMGRISTIVEMNDLTLEDYKTIIRKSKLSPIVLKRLFLKTQDINLRVEDAFVTTVAEEALKLGMGARGIKIVFDKLLDDIDFDVLSGNLSQINLNKKGIQRIKKKNK